IYFERGNLADARQEVRKALQVRPGLFSARLLQVALDRVEKKNSDVEQELPALARDFPQNPLVYREIALYDESLGRPADAEKDFLRVLALWPDSRQALDDLITFYIRGKQTERAIQRINMIPEVKRQAFHYELLGLAYSAAGRLQEAENSYNKALEK